MFAAWHEKLTEQRRSGTARRSVYYESANVNKLTVAILALAVVLAAFLAAEIFGGDDADTEREQRLARAAYAQGFEAGTDSARAALTDTLKALRSKARADSVEAAEANLRARQSRAAGQEMARRLRETLTAEQQEQLDATVDYYEVALAEKDTVIARQESRLALARAEFDAVQSFAARETERANAWKAAYDAAVVEIEALRRPSFDLLSLELDDVPKIAAAAAVGYLAGR